jgi:hypothetical protein
MLSAAISGLLCHSHPEYHDSKNSVAQSCSFAIFCVVQALRQTGGCSVQV